MTLRVEAQDPRAPWAAVSYAPGRLVWSKCNLDNPFDGKVFSEEIDSADIPVFLQEISKLDIFQWGGATYRPPRKVADGTTWAFHLKTTAREVSASGYENSPSHFPEFLLAVKKLTKGKTDTVFMQLGLDRLKSN